jgi:hypothetical protein
VLGWKTDLTGIENKTLTITDATLATQVEAEAGTDNATFMSPLRVQQKITSDLATEAEARAGTDATQFMTPLRTEQAIESLSVKDAGAMNNLGLASSVNLSALTIDLKTSDGSTDPSATDVVSIAFRSPTATEGAFFVRPVVAALTMVVPSGATLGQGDADEAHTYIYAIDNLGTVELAISQSLFDERTLQTTTALTSGSDSSSVLYSTAARSNVPVRVIGRLVNTQTTAGTWASAGSELSAQPRDLVNAKIKAKVFKSASQTGIGTGVTQVTFDSTDYDSHSVFGSNGFTVPRDGQYMIHAQVLTANFTGSGDFINLLIRLDGSTRIRGMTSDPANNPAHAFSGVINCLAGEFIDFDVDAGSDASWDLNGGDISGTYFAIAEL